MPQTAVAWPFDAAAPAAACRRAVAKPGRTRLGELPPALHCSVIGTCLSTAELRQVLHRLHLAPPGGSDHDLHARAVALAGRTGFASRGLGDALDRRHEGELRCFDKAQTEADVRARWRAATSGGDVAGAYWALLTHPATTLVLTQEAFGEVHMLSHLLGAAGRADIARLHALERENADLRQQLTEQRVAAQTALAERGATIEQLRQDLAAHAAAPAASPNDCAAAVPADGAEMRRQLGIETTRRASAEQRRNEAERALATERALCRAMEARTAALEYEVAAVEAMLAPDTVGAAKQRLDGTAILYVGGRRGEAAHLRTLGERMGAVFLYHDGGIEDGNGRLPGLVSRADLVLCPVDCVSHDAALAVKRLCRRSGKRLLPLRTTGAAAFLHAISQSVCAD